MVFALSSTSASSAQTYQLMKDTVNAVIKEHGIQQIHYSIIVFGATPKTFFRFSDTFPNAQRLRDHISSLPRRDGGPSIDEALKQARQLFLSSSVRPSAKKIVVVITDR